MKVRNAEPDQLTAMPNTESDAAGVEGPHSAASFPPTIIVVHPKERRSKCTVEPLRGTDGFVFWNYPKADLHQLEGYVRLGFSGPIIGPDDARRGLLVLDGTWKLVEPMERLFAEVPVRSLPPMLTAYPRTSKLYEDPNGGLATIEAIYAANKLMGRNTDSLLAQYRWADEFMALNRDRFSHVTGGQ
jgi:pre-rRNA-processing protein TSR3